VRPYAEAALEDPNLAPQFRCDMLFLVADDEFKQRKYAEAAELFRQLTRLRRTSADWSYLAQCERALGRGTEGLRALETAANINPLKGRLRRELVEAYGRRKRNGAGTGSASG
jgi:cytochrome c-type biogenesis protein CcmH/NrfG